MPKRFNLSYITDNGTEAHPVVVHRSSIGAFERIMAFLIEHYAGAFPLWLSPVQMVVLPIADRHTEYAKNVTEKLKSLGIRAELDDRKETLQAKIRAATLQKVPFMGIIGDKEISQQSIAVRTREGKDLGMQPVESFLAEIKEKIDKKA